MKTFRTLTVAILFCLPLLSSGQGWAPPPAGKCVVYFVRVAAYQYSVPFTFFDGKKLIADFPSRQYFRYECEPGKHLFWSSSENKEFLPADLKPNQTYIILAEALQGNGLPKVSLIPLHVQHKHFHKAKHIIDNKAPHTEDSQKLNDENERMRPFIEKSVDEFQAANENPELLLTSDQAIPIEKFKKKTEEKQ